LNDDDVARAARKVRGSVKEAIGKLTGNTAIQAEGAAEKATGKAPAPAKEQKDDIRNRHMDDE
jgi:uncharacterized protein YjbJ (UPF0337 family)